MGGEELPDFDHEEAAGPSAATFPVKNEKPDEPTTEEDKKHKRNAKREPGCTAMAAGTQKVVTAAHATLTARVRECSMHKGRGEGQYEPQSLRGETEGKEEAPPTTKRGRRQDGCERLEYIEAPVKEELRDEGELDPEKRRTERKVRYDEHLRKIEESIEDIRENHGGVVNVFDSDDEREVPSPTSPGDVDIADPNCTSESERGAGSKSESDSKSSKKDAPQTAAMADAGTKPRQFPDCLGAHSSDSSSGSSSDGSSKSPITPKSPQRKKRRKEKKSMPASPKHIPATSAVAA